MLDFEKDFDVFINFKKLIFESVEVQTYPPPYQHLFSLGTILSNFGVDVYRE